MYSSTNTPENLYIFAKLLNILGSELVLYYRIRFRRFEIYKYVTYYINFNNFRVQLYVLNVLYILQTVMIENLQYLYVSFGSRKGVSYLLYGGNRSRKL